MTPDRQNQDPSADRPGRTADSTNPAPEPVSVRRKPSAPASGVSARSNTAEAWEQLRQTTTSATSKINDFMARNTGSKVEREHTIRQVAERGREETGRGLRALAEAAGRLADMVDGKADTKDQDADAPRILEQPKAEPSWDAEGR